jgi:hypothetical protein
MSVRKWLKRREMMFGNQNPMIYAPLKVNYMWNTKRCRRIHGCNVHNRIGQKLNSLCSLLLVPLPQLSTFSNLSLLFSYGIGICVDGVRFGTKPHFEICSEWRWSHSNLKGHKVTRITGLRMSETQLSFWSSISNVVYGLTFLTTGDTTLYTRSRSPFWETIEGRDCVP